MDNSSGVGVLDKAAIVLGALEAGPSTLAQLVTAHRSGPADRAPARGRARAPPARRPATCRAASSSARGWPSSPRPPARTGCSPPPGPVLGALRDHTGESAQLFRRQGDQRICVAAAERPGRPARLDPGRGHACPCWPARPPRSCWPGRSPTGCTAACTARSSPRPPCPASAAGAGPRASASASRASPRCRRRCAAHPAGSLPPCRSRARSSGCPASPGGCTPRPSWPAPNKLTEVLRRANPPHQG